MKPYWARNAKGELVTDCEDYPYLVKDEGGSPRCNGSKNCRHPEKHMSEAGLLVLIKKFHQQNSRLRRVIDSDDFGSAVTK